MAAAFMKTWLRWTLVTMTVGGGFTGVVVSLSAFQSFFGSQGQAPPGSFLQMAVFLVLNSYVTVSGLLFVQDPRRTHPLMAALAIQVPWISSAIIAYRFAAGIELVLSVNGPTNAADSVFRLGYAYFLGSSCELSLLQEHPFSLGVNLWALALLLLLWRSSQSPNPVAPPTGTESMEPTLTAHP
jgi:hypothetical protein